MPSSENLNAAPLSLMDQVCHSPEWPRTLLFRFINSFLINSSREENFVLLLDLIR